MSALGTAPGRRSTRSEWSESAAVVVPYARFLERRAWRAKILADFDRSPDGASPVDAADLAVPLAMRRATAAAVPVEP